MKGITKTELEATIATELQKEILEILDSVCPTAFITNRNRKQIIEKFEALLKAQEEHNYWQNFRG